MVTASPMSGIIVVMPKSLRWNVPVAVKPKVGAWLKGLGPDLLSLTCSNSGRVTPWRLKLPSTSSVASPVRVTLVEMK
jgi:hypothetical protein